MTMKGEVVKIVNTGYPQATKGHAGLRCHLPDTIASVSNLGGSGLVNTDGGTPKHTTGGARNRKDH